MKPETSDKPLVEFALTYLIDFVVTVLLLIALSALGFNVSGTNSGLFAAIFTVVIASSTTLFTSVTTNRDLMIATERSGQLVYIISAFTIPIIVSLIGLAVSIVASSFTFPEFLGHYAALGNWFLVFLVLYSILGFLGAVSIITLLQYGTIIKESEVNKES